MLDEQDDQTNFEDISSSIEEEMLEDVTGGATRYGPTGTKFPQPGPNTTGTTGRPWPSPETGLPPSRPPFGYGVHR